MDTVATFALGCFWGPDEYFSKLEGVIQTRVGYTGGSKKDPTYHRLGDHTEVIEITFNPNKISYKDLLDHFWKQHDATIEHKTQYRSAIFFHSEEQEKVAKKSLADQEAKMGLKMATKIEKLSTFYEAEAYHQKYLQKSFLGKLLHR